jgi:ribosome biogenesis GTPase A
MSINADYHNDIKEILTDLSNVLSFEQHRLCPREFHLAGEVEHFKKELKDINSHLQRSELRCPIVGITKAGKSTFINALLGVDLLPYTNVPATFSCIHIRHTPDVPMPQLWFDGIQLAEGAKEVRSAIRSIAEHGRHKGLHSDKELVLDAVFPFLNQCSSENQLRFVLIDTPGVTEADGDLLTTATLQSLRDADAAILALNYAQLRTSEERSFLSLLHLISGSYSQLAAYLVCGK